jgi:hypothetical protein
VGHFPFRREKLVSLYTCSPSKSWDCPPAVIAPGDSTFHPVILNRMSTQLCSQIRRTVGFNFRTAAIQTLSVIRAPRSGNCSTVITLML